MLKDREFIIKLLDCLGPEDKEKVRIFASRCIKKQGLKMKTIERQSLETYLGYTKLSGDGEDNIMYLLFALAALDDENVVPLDRATIDRQIGIIKKTNTMTGAQLIKYMEDQGIEPAKTEEAEKRIDEPVTPAVIARSWLYAYITDRENIEKMLYEYIENNKDQNTDENIREVQVEKKIEYEEEKTTDVKEIVINDGNEKKKIKKLQNDNQDLKIKNDNLKKENDGYKRDIKKYKQDLFNANNEIEKLRDNANNNNSSVKKLNITITEKDNEINQLKAERDALKKELKNRPRVVLFCRSDEKYIKLPSYIVEVIHTPVALESEHLEKCVAVWVVTSDYTYSEILTIRNAVSISTREFYSLDQMIEELEG